MNKLTIKMKELVELIQSEVNRRHFSELTSSVGWSRGLYFVEVAQTRGFEKVWQVQTGKANELGSLVREYFSRPGKGLRSLLLVLSYLIVANRGRDWINESQPTELIASIPDRLWHIATVLERFHISLLAADDYLDRGVLRRGGKALHLMVEDYVRRNGPRYPKAESHDLPFCLVCTILQEAMGDLWTIMDPQDDTINHLPLYLSPWPQSCLHPSDFFNYFREIVAKFEEDQVEAMLSVDQYRLHSYCAEAFRKTLDGEQMDVNMQVFLPDKEDTLGDEPMERLPTLHELSLIQELKTSVYSIKLPLVWGALLADPELSLQTLKDLEIFAINYGQAFQIADDLLALESEAVTGKSAQVDLANGFCTVITVGVADLLPNDEAKDWWVETLKQFNPLIRAWGGPDSDPQSIAEVLDFINSSGVVELCHRMIQLAMDECDKAVCALRSDGYYPEILWRLAKHAINWMDDGLVDVVKTGGGEPPCIKM